MWLLKENLFKSPAMWNSLFNINLLYCTTDVLLWIILSESEIIGFMRLGTAVATPYYANHFTPGTTSWFGFSIKIVSLIQKTTWEVDAIFWAHGRWRGWSIAFGTHTGQVLKQTIRLLNIKTVILDGCAMMAHGLC